MEDIVIDTNVFLHAQNPKERRVSDSTELLNKLKSASTLLCVDEGFEIDESINKSHICAEYLKHLRFGTIGWAVLIILSKEKRIKQVPRRASNNIARKINRMINNKRDRIFLNVSYNSTERVFISHDYKDFQLPKRKSIHSDLGISILEASAVLDQIV